MKVNSSMTVYNKYTNNTTHSDVYQRAVIDEIAWENTKAAEVRATGGQTAANQAVVFIPLLCSGSENYLKPRAWQALSSKTGKWTLQVGDVIVRGTVTDTIGDSFTVSMLKAKYDDVLVISSVDPMDMGSLEMQHWEVGAK